MRIPVSVQSLHGPVAAYAVSGERGLVAVLVLDLDREDVSPEGYIVNVTRLRSR